MCSTELVKISENKHRQHKFQTDQAVDLNKTVTEMVKLFHVELQEICLLNWFSELVCRIGSTLKL